MQSQPKDKSKIILIWLVVISGLAVILGDQLNSPYSVQISLISRTIFWTSAIAYFALRIYTRLRGRGG